MSVTSEIVKRFVIDKLSVEIHPDRKTLGDAAAGAVGQQLRDVLRGQKDVRMVFAAAPSQDEFLAGLVQSEGIDWTRVTAFHMDEYLGLKRDDQRTFGWYLRQRIFGTVPFKKVEYLDSTASPTDECRRYEALLREAPIDIACLGIGENGHLAFNDPPVADFDDREFVKVVALDEACKLQQVHDGCFASLAEVPLSALTMTIPALLSGRMLSVVVPGPRKADAVRRALEGPVSIDCPASILRTQKNAILYLDKQSSSLLSRNLA